MKRRLFCKNCVKKSAQKNKVGSNDMKIKKAVVIIFTVVLAMAIAWILFGALRSLHTNNVLPNNSAGVPADDNNAIPDVPTAPIVPRPIGGDKDAHGCLIGGGYTWCEQKQKCLRTWEEPCAPAKDPGVVCTQDAKQCPDGSYVSRTLPGCQFAKCPGESSQMCGGIAGKMCPSGSTCKYDGNYPDASGTCVDDSLK